jgi:replication fork clamp-binding protein CrfC
MNNKLIEKELELKKMVTKNLEEHQKLMNELYYWSFFTNPESPLTALPGAARASKGISNK